MRVDKNKLADVTEDVGRGGIQRHPLQRVRAQVQEVQMGDVGDDGADLTNTKASSYFERASAPCCHSGNQRSVGSDAKTDP